MGKVNPGSLKDWRDGDVVMAADYKQERELLRVAINDNFDRLIKQVVVQNANGQTKSTANLDEALNILRFKEGANVTLSLDPATATLTIAVTYENSSVGTAAIADGAVTTVKVANSAINTIKIANNAVTEPKIANNAVSTRTIQNGSVTEPKMSDNSISTRTIQSKAVTEGKLNDAAVTTRTIADRAVNTAKLADRSVTEAKIQVGALDNRYYTEAEVDAKLANKTDKTGDHQGTWHGLRVEDIDPDGFDAARITALEKRLDDEEVRDFTISNRLSVVHTDQATPLHLKRLEGRTVVNHVPLFDSGLWSLNNGVAISSPTSITITGVSGTYVRARSPRIFVKPNTTYTLSFDLDNETGLGYVEKHRADGSIIGNTTSRTFVTDSDCAYVIVQLDNRQLSGTFTFNNVAINEGSTAQEFVAGMKNLSGFYLKRYGKNILPPFNEWTISSYNYAQTDLISPYELKFTRDTAGGIVTIATIEIPIMPNTTYTLNLDTPDGAGKIVYETFDFDGNNLSYNTSATQPKVFTTEHNAAYVRVRVQDNGDARTTTLKNPILNLGSEPLPFEPQNTDYLYADVELASAINAAVKDVLEYRDGRYWKTKKIGKVILDGAEIPPFESVVNDLSYGDTRTTVSASWLGYTGSRPENISSVVLCTYDGRIIPRVNSGNDRLPGSVSFQWTTGGAISLFIPFDLSGWVSAITPNASAVRAFFNGWKAILDNDTKYTHWVSILNPNPNNVVTDEDYVASVKAPGWTGWATLQYQLAESVTEDVTDKVEGAISLYEGDNQVEMGEAVVVRELANPQYGSGSGNYHINNRSFPTNNYFEYRAEKPVQIYKNGAVDHNWKIVYANGYGKFRMEIIGSKFDTTATYTVTYIAESWQLSSAAQSVDVQYTANVKTALDRNIQDVADLATQVSAIPSIYARKHQEQWIEPTLLNNWSGVARYYKDELGTVHVMCSISGGIAMSGAVLFVLPEGYRPDISPSRTFVAYTTTSAPTPDIAFVDVHTDGRVRIASSEFKNPTFAFSISFRAR